MNEPPERLRASAPNGTEWFGGAVDETRAVLRVMARTRGGPVDVSLVSEALGCLPNVSNPRHWALRAPDSDSGDLESQIDWILSRVSPDTEVWSRLCTEYRVDLFCGVYLYAKNRGLVISAKSMAAQSSRGIEIGLDIYSENET